MNREDFIKGLSTEKNTLDENVLDLIRRSIDSNLGDGNPRGHRNLIIVNEELAELTKEISKELRGKGDRISIIEEFSDVQLALWYIQEIVGISDDEITRGMNTKLHRLEETLNKKGVYI